MFYYTVANLTSKFRSKHCAVRLLAIENANLVKRYGIDNILQPIISDIKELHDGCIMEINGDEVHVYGKVLECTGEPWANIYGQGLKKVLVLHFSNVGVVVAPLIKCKRILMRPCIYYVIKKAITTNVEILIMHQMKP